MEAHIVHYNSKYKDFQEAVGKNDGIAVVAVFIQASGDRDCNEFAKIADCVRHIQQPKSKCAINSGPSIFMSIEMRILNPFQGTYFFCYCRLLVIFEFPRAEQTLLYVQGLVDNRTIQRMCYVDYLSNTNLCITAAGIVSV